MRLKLWTLINKYVSLNFISDTSDGLVEKEKELPSSL